jgi:hypothetical protein
MIMKAGLLIWRRSDSLHTEMLGLCGRNGTEFYLNGSITNRSRYNNYFLVILIPPPSICGQGVLPRYNDVGVLQARGSHYVISQKTGCGPVVHDVSEYSKILHIEGQADRKESKKSFESSKATHPKIVT